MRSTGSRESRESRDASATSPTSIAVKTFSIRLGSRRNQRPSHQKMRSSTTVTATIETIRIGHMIGPPFLKLSIRKFPVVVSTFTGAADAAGDAPAAGLKVASPLAPGAGAAGDVPGAPGAAGPPAGGGIAGFAGAAGAPVAGTPVA